MGLQPDVDGVAGGGGPGGDRERLRRREARSHADVVEHTGRDASADDADAAHRRPHRSVGHHPNAGRRSSHAGTGRHQRAIVQSEEGDKVKVIGRDGQLVEMDGTSGSALQSGDDVVLVTRRKALSSDQVETRSSEPSTAVDDRIASLKTRLEDAGDTGALERLQEREDPAQKRRPAAFPRHTRRGAAGVRR